MKRLFSSKYLSAVLIAAAFAAIGAVPASAQALSHYGSVLPHYFDASGELKWGAWAPSSAEHKVIIPSHNLYLYAKPHAHRAGAR